jgi:hypothetical protein
MGRSRATSARGNGGAIQLREGFDSDSDIE